MNTPTAKILITQSASNWVGGIIGEDHTFEAKVHDNPSPLGINEGRISKLFIKSNSGQTVFNYDRGPDIGDESDPLVQAVLNLFPH
jgi:hypothetical protein